ncbi:MAG: CBS domain-containing protein [Planctomycetota bacterium]
MTIQSSLKASLKAKWGPMKVKENMSSHVASVGPGASATEIARLLRDQHIGCVPVLEGEQLIGMVTDRDVTCRILAEGRDPDKTTASDFMSKDVSVCFEDDFLTHAAEIMEDKHVRRLAVVDRDKHLVGILTADDLSWHTDHMLLGEVVESVYERHG